MMRKQSKKKEFVLKWYRWYFTPENEGYLDGYSNWRIYKDSFYAACRLIGLDISTWLTYSGKEITEVDERLLALKLKNTTKASFLDKLVSLHFGTQLCQYLEALFESRNIAREVATLHVTHLEYRGGDPTKFVTQWNNKVRQQRLLAAEPLSINMERILFLSAIKKKAHRAYNVVRLMEREISTKPVSLGKIKADFTDEIRGYWRGRFVA
ncbi:uncharacterized protein BCR38DRAFT_410268 [Pseudomassariella vexata]|uniref:Uncharacterized protein n=1 Tax=Pseudomassariella vexata TaxID=1141098 RepID=A0A1Y2DVP6_9PEZI|nr:uncharacterized protein BCR38DRAFT_410268 [Pseudomassariella vexata]ORY63333.1 hypothetical protein BCR38DRAFT_410268 [Pseudomassariella vexata]